MRASRRRAVLLYTIVVTLSVLVSSYLTGFLPVVFSTRVVFAVVVAGLFVGGVATAVVAIRKMFR